MCQCFIFVDKGRRYITSSQQVFLTFFSSYRLRYHGSYLSPVPTKSNGEVTVKIEKRFGGKKDAIDRLKINANDYTFSFETVPKMKNGTRLSRDKIDRKNVIRLVEITFGTILFAMQNIALKTLRS
ncbi:uncharacterized protein LOC115888283 [Sitophilus oryzae]|uniref:Uncharacterized protein LOC115888283 n=1 Tax=Sitophilus oryzae TaxID=7048 RepID=A0A6J2YKZ3_SITOR|nr:uncharacterized protein LOC115888283 [Sitophilus oryzae]